MTLKWKTDWSLGRYSRAGLEVGSVSSRLRLQDLQIKGKPEKGKSMCAEALYLWICSQAHSTTLNFINGKDYALSPNNVWILRFS